MYKLLYVITLLINFTLKITRYRIPKPVKEVLVSGIGSNYFRILISKIYDFHPKLTQGGTKLGSKR